MLNTDIVIVGGGIAGLWTLHKLKQHGYNVVLLEADALGAGQTIMSQGIIHGGLKYALQGGLNSATNALRDMPTYWQQCLKGNGEIDLSSVEILATGQYMWSNNKLTGGLSTLFASHALHSQVESIDRDAWPLSLQHAALYGKVYKLSELILNIPELIKVMASKFIDHCIKIDSAANCQASLDPQQNIAEMGFTVRQQPIKLRAQCYIFTAGNGNAELTKTFTSGPRMQQRPLQMVLVKSPNLSALYGHCVGLAATPRITITTHTASDGTTVWYLGGKLAEDGVSRSQEQQLACAQQELRELFPTLDLSTAQWASFFINRAEEQQADGSKPNSVSVCQVGNCITAWPTKLALAPILAEQILAVVQQQNIKPNPGLTPLDKFIPPIVATPIWDKLL